MIWAEFRIAQIKTLPKADEESAAADSSPLLYCAEPGGLSCLSRAQPRGAKLKGTCHRAGERY